MSRRIFRLDYMIVTVEDGMGEIESVLGTDFDQVESVVLALAFAGVDIGTPEFNEGINSAINSICNLMDDQ